MKLEHAIQELTTQEKKVLLTLNELKGQARVQELCERAKLEQVAVMRGALGLKEKGLVSISETPKTFVALTEEGLARACEGLPERRVLQALVELKEATPEELASRAKLSEELLGLSLGWLKRRRWAEFKRVEGRVKLTLTPEGERALREPQADEQLLERLAQAQSLSLEELPEQPRAKVKELRERRLVELKQRIERSLALTELGRKALELGVTLEPEVSQLTHELLVSGRWRGVKLRRYDVTAPCSPLYPGKIHPQQQVIDEIRELLLGMGFVEIKSDPVIPEFWNFDALFQAQDHPAREVHDSLSLAKPKAAQRLPEELVRKVAEAHERGVAGSRGWGSKFDPGISRRLVLCSQTTAATIKYLAHHPEPPAKVFCIDRVYRHERIDYKHLAEFYQCEGIVMNPGLTLRDMLGYLKQIVTGLGFERIRFRPGYFPFTEPSVEADVYHPERKEWIEVVGAGMFRPEVLRPLGVHYPVLAWGIGLSRLIMLRLGLEDIRGLFSNDLSWISARAWGG